VIEAARLENTVLPTEGLALSAGEANLAGSMELCLLDVEVRGREGRNVARPGRRAADWLLRRGTDMDVLSAVADGWSTTRMAFGLSRRRFLDASSGPEASGLEGLRLTLPFEGRSDDAGLESEGFVG
jgi:hypothetical protein